MQRILNFSFWNLEMYVYHLGWPNKSFFHCFILGATFIADTEIASTYQIILMWGNGLFFLCLIFCRTIIYSLTNLSQVFIT